FSLSAVAPPPPTPPPFPYTTLFRSRFGAGHGASTLFHQYFPRLAAGPPLPHDCPQRRNQYGQGQLQLAARPRRHDAVGRAGRRSDRKSTRLNSSHVKISYAVFCLKK